ncbi:MAG: hypothetical protein R3320_07445 [Nitriliruptorales bacterium]|nr:hypothetical protein [Nitriliruptorales bacterium]
MKARKALALVTATVAAIAATALPAVAADTDATVTLTSSGTLSVAVPDSSAAPVNLGSTAVPTTASTFSSTTFGTVTVDDTRAGTLGWTATATGTHFCIDSDTGTTAIECSSDTNQQILNTAITYKPGTFSVSLGDGTLLTGVDATLSVGSTVSYTGTGNSTVSWNPTLDFALLATQVAGTYQGTITHNVS